MKVLVEIDDKFEAALTEYAESFGHPGGLVEFLKDRLDDIAEFLYESEFMDEDPTWEVKEFKEVT